MSTGYITTSPVDGSAGSRLLDRPFLGDEPTTIVRSRDGSRLLVAGLEGRSDDIMGLPFTASDPDPLIEPWIVG